MSIQKKSLISTLKTAKKANVAATVGHDAEAKGEKVSSMRVVNQKYVNLKGAGVSSTRAMYLKGTGVSSTKSVSGKSITSAKSVKAKGISSAKSSFLKKVAD